MTGREPKATSTNPFSPVNLTLGSRAFGQAQGRTGLSTPFFCVITLKKRTAFISVAAIDMYLYSMNYLYFIAVVIISPVRFVVSGLKFNFLI